MVDRRYDRLRASWRDVFAPPGYRGRPPAAVYEAQLDEQRHLRLVRPVVPAFDWERDVPELRPHVPTAPRTVEVVVVDGMRFLVSRPTP